MKRIRILDLGSGFNKLKGSIGIDKNKECKPDVVHDLNKFPIHLEIIPLM